jgi:hypothetical protein
MSPVLPTSHLSVTKNHDELFELPAIQGGGYLSDPRLIGGDKGRDRGSSAPVSGMHTVRPLDAQPHCGWPQSENWHCKGTRRLYFLEPCSRLPGTFRTH